jgi:PHD/YefM family antitoxin component YafN of YafNO toxin-antitoxin module
MPDEETLAILSDPELLASLREADAEVVAGATIQMPKQEALAELER